MQPSRTLVIAAVGLALLAGMLVLVPPAGAGPAGSWDQFQQCKIDCNEGYGGLDVNPPALSGARGLGYSNCVLRCERRYWKNFDKDMQNMENE